MEGSWPECCRVTGDVAGSQAGGGIARSPTVANMASGVSGRRRQAHMFPPGSHDVREHVIAAFTVPSPFVHCLFNENEKCSRREAGLYLLGLIFGAELAGVIAAFVAHGRREAAGTALELTALNGCVLVLAVGLLYASASIRL